MRTLLTALAIIGLALSLTGCALAFLPGCYLRSSPTLEPAQLPPVLQGQALAIRLTLKGGRPTGLYVDPKTPLPPGVTLTYRPDEGDAELGGRPTTAGDYSFTVYGMTAGTQCTGQVAERHYPLRVLAPD